MANKKTKTYPTKERERIVSVITIDKNGNKIEPSKDCYDLFWDKLEDGMLKIFYGFFVGLVALIMALILLPFVMVLILSIKFIFGG